MRPGRKLVCAPAMAALLILVIAPPARCATERNPAVVVIIVPQAAPLETWTAARYLEVQLDEATRVQTSTSCSEIMQLLRHARETWPERSVVVLDGPRGRVAALRPMEGTALAWEVDDEARTSPYFMALAAAQLLDFAKQAEEGT